MAGGAALLAAPPAGVVLSLRPGGYQLYRVLGPDQEIVEFSDLAEAWNTAKGALFEAGIDLSEVPVFLVLGRTASSLHCASIRFAADIRRGASPPQSQSSPKSTPMRPSTWWRRTCLLGRQAELLFATAEEPEPQVSKAEKEPLLRRA